MLVRIVAAIGLLVEIFPLRVSADLLKLRRAINDVHRQSKAIDLVVDRQFHGRIDVALFFVPTNVHLSVVGPPVRQAVNEPGIAMEVEDDRFVDRE